MTKMAHPCSPGWPWSAKTPPRPISLEFRVPWLHAAGMKTLLVIMVVQSLNLVVFWWEAW